MISPTCKCKAFTSKDPKSIKIQSSCQYHFALLGSTNVKTARKMLLKLTPEGMPKDTTSGRARASQICWRCPRSRRSRRACTSSPSCRNTCQKQIKVFNQKIFKSFPDKKSSIFFVLERDETYVDLRQYLIRELSINDVTGLTEGEGQ